MGGYFEEDKKYFMKEFLFFATYAVASLNINHVIVWPAALSSILLPSVFFIFEVVLKNFHTTRIEQFKNDQKRVNQVEVNFEI